ncbi:MAG TPA: GNAT family N-acetyltransferase [Burkholderiales bacterium]|nr:GNAT family N-acetyltransferase [Burkholderiales bacterium]
MGFEKNLEVLHGSGVELEVCKIAWDSEVFGFPVAQIERISLHGAGLPVGTIRELAVWLSDNAIRLASCRLASDQLHESMLLEANGFRFVEMIYAPTLELPSRLAAAPSDLAIGPASPQDLPAIKDIAGTAFSTGRFLLDWRLDGTLSHRRYRWWVENSFLDERQQVLKATCGGALVGFFIVEERPDRSVYWHLTAVAPEWQNRGIGKRLWTEMTLRHSARNLRRIETTISAHNTAVMNLYADLGFRFTAPRMTFHWIKAAA